MKERTDSERLEFYFKRTGIDCYVNRKEIDTAMDASEAAELDEAWGWFRASPLPIERHAPASDIYIVPDGRSGASIGKDRAILAAYRASKGKP